MDDGTNGPEALTRWPAWIASAFSQVIEAYSVCRYLGTEKEGWRGRRGLPCLNLLFTSVPDFSST